jgi:hypothetical protein
MTPLGWAEYCHAAVVSSTFFNDVAHWHDLLGVKWFVLGSDSFVWNYQPIEWHYSERLNRINDHEDKKIYLIMRRKGLLLLPSKWLLAWPRSLATAKSARLKYLFEKHTSFQDEPCVHGSFALHGTCFLHLKLLLFIQCVLKWNNHMFFDRLYLQISMFSIDVEASDSFIDNRKGYKKIKIESSVFLLVNCTYAFE